ncbi:11337_t:CDS:2 [Entrophospora sp. SA101]|nr:4467_t:CDS:2 [Entrophospora sp. SA101]CAJ0634147.1 11337_t:CDS:2 [Entrophospora sp. SA101]
MLDYNINNIDVLVSFCKCKFENLNIRIKKAWLTDRVQKSCSENTNNTNNKDELFNKIYKEFLKSNLKDSIYPTIPRNIIDSHLIMIAEDKPVVLQIVDIVETGVSTLNLIDIVNSYLAGSFKQGHKYKHISEKIENNDVNIILPRSLLKLILSDGSQLFDVMEYKPIKDLSLLTPIGTKVSISKVQVLRGYFRLVPENISILGGFENIDQYKYLNVLLEKLKKQLSEKDTVSLLSKANINNNNSQKENYFINNDIDDVDIMGTSPPQKRRSGASPQDISNIIEINDEEDKDNSQSSNKRRHCR